MIRRVLTGVLTTGFALAAASALQAGGWVVITTEVLPDQVVAGKPIVLEYAVRQHGRTLVDGLTGQVEARVGKRIVTAVPTPAGRKGFYTVTFTLPTAGLWTVAIDSGFGGNYDASRFTLQAIDSSAPPPTVSELERGRQLLAAKGCVMCHVAPGFDGPTVDVGPSLTRSIKAESVKAFFARLQAEQDPRSEMPNLALREDEITSIAEYLSRKKI